MINVPVTWAFIPIPFIFGLLVSRLWLFRPDDQIDKLRQIIAASTGDIKQQIKKVLDETSDHNRFAAIKKVLAAHFQKAELTPIEYLDKKKSYEVFFEERLKGDLSDKRLLIFGLGERRLLPNTIAAMTTGAVLASIPVLIAMYQYMPISKVDYPYPIASFFTFIVLAAAKWILYAIFFGF